MNKKKTISNSNAGTAIALPPLPVQPSYSYNKDLANEVLFALHPDVVFWAKHATFGHTASEALAAMSLDDFDAMVDLIKQHPPGLDDSFMNFVGAPHHALRPGGSSETKTRLKMKAQAFEKTTTGVSPYWSIGFATLGAFAPFISTELTSLAVVAGHVTLLTGVGGAGGLIAGHYAGKSWDKFRAAKKSLSISDWSNWEIPTFQLDVDAEEKIKNLPRGWDELEARFALLTEPERWLSLNASASNKVRYLLAKTAAEKRSILEQRPPSLSQEFHYLVASGRFGYDGQSSSVGMLQSVGGLAWHAVANKWNSIKKRPNVAGVVPNLPDAIFSAVPGDHFSPTSINERLAKFRDRLIAPTQSPTRKLSF